MRTADALKNMYNQLFIGFDLCKIDDFAKTICIVVTHTYLALYTVRFQWPKLLVDRRKKSINVEF